VVAALALMLLGACTGAVSETSMSRQPASPAVDDGPIRFDVLGGDAFAWSERVTGTSDCGAVGMAVNGREVDDVAMVGTVFRATVPLGPGRNEVVASCASGVRSDPLIFDERLVAGPTAWIDVSVHGDTVVLDGSRSEAARADAAKVVDYAWHRDPRHPMQLTLASGAPLAGSVQGERLELRAPSRDGEYFASLTVTDAKGRTDTATRP
jgi:hypothetical protein